MSVFNSAKIKTVAVASIGAAGCIFILSLFTEIDPSVAFLMAPFGATMVIVFALPEGPLAQPRNVFLGHALTAVVGLVMLHYAGVNSLTLAIAVGLGVAVMMLADAVHPPAGANPLLVMLTGQAWDFLFMPVMSGAIVIILFAVVYHRFVSGAAYPKRWF